MNRRSFISSSLIATGIALFAPQALLKGFEPKKHILYGDGIHDDTEALQAWCNGEQVEWPVNGKEFLLTGTVIVGAPKSLIVHRNGYNNVLIENCRFSAE